MGKGALGGVGTAVDATVVGGAVAAVPTVAVALGAMLDVLVAVAPATVVPVPAATVFVGGAGYAVFAPACVVPVALTLVVGAALTTRTVTTFENRGCASPA